ncbi:MAG: putative Ig domain-containing protein [Acidobacteriaceae bacterium]|nr:putative Ig domain-containing protein [Acidobacteriaceae bacterium]
MVGCGGSPAAPAISVAITTVPSAMVAGATQTFAATVSNDSSSAGVNWSASVGSISSAGIYTAPTPVATASATITATSKTDTSKTSTATVTLTPVAVSVTTVPVAMIAGGTQTFVANVTGDTALNQGVTWSASAGTISAGGVYTAPIPVATASATITATSKTDTSKTSTATVTLTPISVAITTTPVTLVAGATETFGAIISNDITPSAGVTWSSSVGSITAGGVYTAPTPVSTASAIITATSKTDPSKSATMTVTLTPVVVTIPFAPVAIAGAATEAITATLTGDTTLNAGVTWSITSGGGTLSAVTTTSVTYTAPLPVTTANAVITATSKTDPSKTATLTIPLIPISVGAISPSTATLGDSNTQAFTGATVANDSSNSGVTWSISPATGAGTIISSTGAYNAPTTVISSVTTATVTAASVKDPTKTATATVTLDPIAVAVSASTSSMVAGATQTFTPTVSYDGSNSGVTWSASVGSVSSAGVYTAPTPVATASATITATSVKDPTRNGTTIVTLTPISVAITTVPVAMVAGATQTFAATVSNDITPSAGVTWSASVGSISSAGVYTAPTPVATASATITATSKTDPSKSTTATVTLTPIVVTIPTTPTAIAGAATEAITATLTGDTTLNAGVTWSITSGGGTLSAVTTTSVTYTAPLPVTTANAVITATSKTDPSKTATLTIPLIPISVGAISPSTATLGDSSTQAFAGATVANDSSNSGVTWSISPATGAGTIISSTGAYNAPTTVISSVTTVTVTAASVKDPTKTATATITLQPIMVGPISPATVSLSASGTKTFAGAVLTYDGSNSGVTWSISPGTGAGTIVSTTGAYTAPTVVSGTSPVTVTVTATSVKDTTKTTTATITLNPVSLTVSPTTATLVAGQPQTFTATVSNDGATPGVTWTASVGSITSAGVYTAPTPVGAASATITATSKTDPTKSFAATVTLTPVSTVTISPGNVTLIGGASATFTPVVTGDSYLNAGVTWNLSPSTGAGTITSAGVYTAPAVIGSVTNVMLSATSITDPSRTSSSSSITLTPISIAFTTTTNGITLDSGQTMPLTASVSSDSSSSGATFAVYGAGFISPISATGNTPSTTLTASSTIASAVSVTATSIKDSTKQVSTSSITINPALAIATASGALPAGTTGVGYAGTTIAASGGTGSDFFAVATGSLPTGMTLNAFTGAISGTPTSTAGTYTFTVKVTDSATTPVTATSGTYTIYLNPAPLTVVAVGWGSSYTVGTAITPFTVTSTGGTGTITYGVYSGTLPAGLSLNSSTGVVSGTPSAPTVASGNSIAFKATDSASTPVTAVAATVILTVNPVTLAISAATLPTGYVGSAYNTNGYQFTSTGGTGTITWSMYPNPVDGLTLSPTGLLSGTPTGTYSSTVTITATDSATNQQQSKSITPALTINNPVTITTTQSSLPVAYSGVAYTSTTLAASGGTSPYTWSVTSGLTGSNSLATLNLAVSSAGVITGTPATTGIANFTVQVTDSATPTHNTNSVAYSITAYTPLSLPSTDPSTLGPATTTSSYTGSIPVTGGVAGYTWTINSVVVSSGSASLGNGTLVASPSGATLNITGTPSAAGTVTFTASVKDSTGTSTSTITYTIAVTTSYSINGQLNLSNACSVSSWPVFTLTLTQSGNTVGTTTSNSGSYSFTNIANGTYTLTPSITGPSSVFYPASQSVTVTNGNISVPNFSAALGYTVSGTASYSGINTVSQAKPIYLSLSGGCSNSNPGTSVSTAGGSFTIHGVAPGTYTLSAFQDNMGYGSQNASNPTGSTSGLTVSTANVTGANVTLTDPATVTLTSAPKLQGVAGFNNGVLAQYKAITNSNSIEMATSYTLQWSTTSTFTAIAGSMIFPATGGGGADIWFVNSAMTTGCTNCSTLASGTYYFRAYATSAGTATSSYSVFSSSGSPVAVTVGAPTGGVAVSGTVTYPGTATGPLYVGFFNYSTGNFYGEYIASPQSAQAFTIQVPIASTYYFVGVIDNNNDGVVDAGDINDVSSEGNPPTANITGATSSENLTLTGGNSVVLTYTGHNIQTGQSDTYTVNADVRAGLKLPVAVELISATNPDVIVPQDVAACTSCGNPQFQWQGSTQTTVPSTNDSYGLKVTYSDGTSDASLPATVSTVLTSAAAATVLTPQTGTSTSTTPTFSWTYPTNASNYTYQFWVCCSSNSTIWDIPGNNSNTKGFTSSQVPVPAGIPWITSGNDILGESGNLPTISALSTATTYTWTIQTIDSNNNYVQNTVSYEP